MKTFHCGEVVPGCRKSVVVETQEQAHRAPTALADNDYQMAQVQGRLLDQPQAFIQDSRAT